MASGDSSGAPLGGLLGLDRKAMEAERLARRAKKRDRSISPPVRQSRKAFKLEPDAERESSSQPDSLPSVKTRRSAAASAAIEQAKPELLTHQPPPTPANSAVSSFDVETLPHGAIKYPNGVVKKTWAFGHERTGTDIKIEEVLEARSLRIAVLSAFQWDLDWILSKLKTPERGGSTKCVFVMQAKGDEERATMRTQADAYASFLRLCLPPMDGLIYCMHSKLMLLFHPDKLRVAVPTANLLNFDWGETGQMENSVFIIDLPRLSPSQIAAPGQLTPFCRELLYFAEKQGLDQDVRDGMLKFDFSATAGMAFVHTVGGIHYGQHAERTGLLGLSRAIRSQDLESSPSLELDFAASSIGQLNAKYLHDFHCAARGLDAVQAAREARSASSSTFFKPAGRRDAAASSSCHDVTDRIRIYFPTSATVRASTAGSAGTLCLQRSYFEARTFPRSCFRDYTSLRAGLLSHNKLLCARGRRLGGEERDLAWVYVGSANMSKSAWGELPADRANPKISCRNWECGVVLPVAVPGAARGQSQSEREAAEKREEEKKAADPDETDSDVEADPAPRSLVGFDVFRSVIDLPFHVPGEKYNGREPWYFKEQ